ncbi:MAG: cytochrome b N-terminal domain-containing protein [Deltaproteobacteria bacterium]|nr:cytochrome b N-terminal domain-containing protein [Deltaproteobacteria bacterium]
MHGDAREHPPITIAEAASSASDPARAEAPIVGEAIFLWVERPFLWIDRASARIFGDRFNPFAHTGAIANTLLAVAVISGALLLFWYSPSVHQAYGSMRAIEDAFVPRLIRSLHRYSSDACLFFVGVHAARLVAARRFTGARWLAWITGLAATALVWLIGWLGYWLVWDERARQVALGTARVLDVLPIFGDPLSRAFLADASVNSLLFFIVFFLHMLIPMALVIALWLHIARLQRPSYLAHAQLATVVCALLVLVSAAIPALAAGPARMTVVPGALSLDYWYLVPLFATDRMSGAAMWTLGLAGALLVLPLPWILRKKPARTAEIATSRCNACEQCATDCPYEAIQLVPRTDGRPFAVQAEVDPARCVGCGICVGSCSTAGTALPGIDMLQERARIERLLDAARDKPAVLFACSDALPSGFVDDERFLVVRMPCAGWLQAVSVERALRHGAKEIVVAGCTSCRFREGLKWTEARLQGDRKVGLSANTDRARVRIVSSDRTTTSRSFMRAVSATNVRPIPAFVRRSAQLAVITLVTAVIVGGSVLPYAPPQPSGPELVISLKQTGIAKEECRTLSEAELAQRPPHMRQPRVCERRRAAVGLRVVIDGVEARATTYPAQGIWGDGVSVGLEAIPITRGTHEISVTIDNGQSAYTDTRRLQFDEAQRHVLLFERSTGFHWQ